MRTFATGGSVTMNKDKLKTIGENCRRLRKENKTTLSELASKIGCSINYLSMFEKGKADSVIIFFKYLSILNCPNVWTTGEFYEAHD